MVEGATREVDDCWSGGRWSGGVVYAILSLDIWKANSCRAACLNGMVALRPTLMLTVVSLDWVVRRAEE